MPKTVQIIDGAECTLASYGALKICTIIKDGSKIERTYLAEYLQCEEIRQGYRTEIRHYKCGKLHRDRSPACYIQDVGFSGEYWFKNGKRHRVDGPAITETVGGKTYKAYYKDDWLVKKTRRPINGNI